MTRSHADHDQLLPAGEPDQHIELVGPDRRLDAVQRLVGGAGRAGRGQAQRFIEFALESGIPLDAMWAQIAGDTVRETVLAVPNPGRTAMLFAGAPGRVTHGGQTGLATLIDHACRTLARDGVHLAQALVEPNSTRLCDAYRAGGLVELARLSYMERPLPGSAIAPEPLPPGITLETYGPDREEQLLTVLDASYEDTLDCPKLRGMRDTRDILAGHRGTGEFDAGLWTLLLERGVPRGALLLNRSPASNAIELVYIGLAKSARGRGLGRRLLRHGLRSVRGRAERAVTLAVDEQNEPAIAMYRDEGFRRVLRRVALIRCLRERSSSVGPERTR